MKVKKKKAKGGTATLEKKLDVVLQWPREKFRKKGRAGPRVSEVRQKKKKKNRKKSVPDEAVAE